jgi:NAD(P)H-hydrate epimerase
MKGREFINRKDTIIPVISTDQMREVDRLMIETYGISLLQMMENAGRNMALLARQYLGGDIIDKKICVVVGRGNNGGGGLVAARHLSNWGAEVTILVPAPSTPFKPVAWQQLETVRHLPVSVVPAGSHTEFIDWCSCQLVIDAIFGYGLNRPPSGLEAETIEKINGLSCPVLSLDTPSGLDTTCGYRFETIIRADATMTLALPKTGLIDDKALDYVGDLYIGDISVPPILYRQIGVQTCALFEEGPIIPYRVVDDRVKEIQKA